MKKGLCVFLATLLLLTLAGCGERAEPTFMEMAEVETVTPTPTPTPTPTQIATSTPEPTPTLESTPTPEPTESIKIDELQWARDCLKRAEAALAPFLGETPTEGESDVDEGGRIWRRLTGYKTAEELREGLRGPFTQELADDFFARSYEGENPIIKEEAGHVYVRADSRDVLGYYYKIKYDTLRMMELEEMGPSVYQGEYSKVLLADGVGEDAAILWMFGFMATQDDSYQIDRYQCDLNDERNPLTIMPGGRPYQLGGISSPTWLGEPERVEYGVFLPHGEDVHKRTEYYDGLTVTMIELGWEENRRYTACYITVTKPGIPTADGVEVGDTKREVLADYPQFHLDNIGCEPMYPSWVYSEYLEDTAYFHFDENYVLTEIDIRFNLSN